MYIINGGRGYGKTFLNKLLKTYNERRIAQKMREIEFRGFVADEPNEWVYGHLVSNSAIHQTKEHKSTNCCGIGTFSVIPESVGQFTGKRDVNKLKIYENDILRDIEDNYYVVGYMYEAFVLLDITGEFAFFLGDMDGDCLTKIGNTYEVEDEK